MKKNRSGRLINFEKVLRIKALREQGLSMRKIAEKTTLALSTVLKYVKMLEAINFEVEEKMLQKFKSGELTLKT